MDSITIYPKNEKQQSLLKSLLEEMKIRFEVGRADEQTEFISKIDKSIKQAESGKTKKLAQNEQKKFLGL